MGGGGREKCFKILFLATGSLKEQLRQPQFSSQPRLVSHVSRNEEELRLKPEMATAPWMSRDLLNRNTSRCLCTCTAGDLSTSPKCCIWSRASRALAGSCGSRDYKVKYQGVISRDRRDLKHTCLLHDSGN